jgi:thioredoxin-related protein
VVALGLFIFIKNEANAQSGKLPPFRIMQSNGKVFKAENLPIGKPIIIIYFSPDCDHCQVFMKQFFKRASEFNRASVAMITYLPVDHVTKFIKEYQIRKFPNVTVGTEGSGFFLRNYYRITELPFLALYDKNGNLISSHQKNIPLNDVAGKLKKL